VKAEFPERMDPALENRDRERRGLFGDKLTPPNWIDSIPIPNAVRATLLTIPRIAQEMSSVRLLMRLQKPVDRRT
jgi:hypothetical protein